MFPQLSDIEDKIYYRILSRANAIDAKEAVKYAGGTEKDYQQIENTSGLLNTSKLNTWIKALSGAKSSIGKGNGMILKSIQDWEIFNTINRGEGTYYGTVDIGAPRSGTIGINLDGNPIETKDTTNDRLLRPSPIITGLEIKEGQDQISRECTLSIKCFTLAQLEVIQTYFMEPGYTLYIEYGWNTPNLVGPLQEKLFGVRYPDIKLIEEASSRGLNYDKLHQLRVDSSGDFDCFLGFIVGGSVSTENETFNVTVNLRGQPGLPTYLQSQHKMYSLKEGKVVEPDPKILYEVTELQDAEEQPNSDVVFKAKQRFKYMFNDLSAQRQNQEVKDLEIKGSGLVSLTRFINFDKTIQLNIAHYTDPTWKDRAREFFGGDFSDADTVVITNENNVRVEIDKKDLFAENRFIKMDLAVKILNANNKIESYIVGGKNVSVKINIDNSVIGAFKYMFSTNPTKLIIPGEMPDFARYFLNADDVSHGSVDSSGIFHAENMVVGGNTYPPVDNSISGVSFVQKVETPSEIPYREGPNHWGYLKDLFVNFDMFNSKIKQPNKTIGEVFLDILNEMSSAANSYWNFQIVESKDKNGDIILTIIDENFVGKPNGAPSQRKVFYHSGIQSPFLESSLDLSIPAEMANKLILSRLSYTSNPDSQFAQGGSFFNSSTDLFLQSVAKTGTSGPPPPPPPTPAGDEEVKRQKAIQDWKDADAIMTDALKDTTKWTRRNVTVVTGVGSDPTPRWVYTFTDKALQTKYDTAKSKADLANIEYRANGGKFPDVGAELSSVASTKAKNTASENLKKIALVPNPEQPLIAKDDIGPAIVNIDLLRNLFRAYTLNDVTYFDMLKQNEFQNKRNEKNFGLSHPLPITYRFKTMGVSGMRRGDMFNIDGIPAKYQLNGVFQITELEQSVQDSLWTTSVTGKYRQFVKEM